MIDFAFPTEEEIRLANGRGDIPTAPPCDPHESALEAIRESLGDSGVIPDPWENHGLTMTADGELVDQWGEIVSPDDLPSLDLPAEFAPLIDPFQVNSRDDANNALEIRFNLEAQNRSLDDRLKAFTANIEAQKRRIRSRLAWWDFRWSPKLVTWAKTALVNKKGIPFGSGKTVALDFGRVSFRDSPETIEILDDAAALEWARKWAPERIKTKESITMTSIKEAIEELKKEGMEASLPFVKDVPKVENKPSIKTGI